MKPAGAGPVAWLRGIGIAIGAVLLSLAINPTLGLKHPFLVSYPAVLVSAWVGGPIASLLTTFLLAAAATYFWLPPLYGLAVSDEGDAIALFVFLGAGAVITGLAIAFQRTATRLTAFHREADEGPNARDTSSDHLQAVAEALRTSEVLIFVRKRAERPEQSAERKPITRLAAVDVPVRSSIWIAPTDRTMCDTCGQSIPARDIAYEIVAAGHDICIDRACYQRLIAAVESGALRLN